MAKYCPVRERNVLYLDCLECEEQDCLSPHASITRGSRQLKGKENGYQCTQYENSNS